MTPTNPFKLPPGHLNQVILILILIVVVAGLVLTVLALPGFNIPATPTTALTLAGELEATPDPAQLTATAVAAAPPMAQVESIVITGGILVLIVLAAALRELFRSRDGAQ
ncbi:MAG TPA: hypothetical protein PKL82_04290 [Anaerolineaceae bacterium]|jgi:hypothetical protein|nr:hypothetical protein [Anaerolineaceae bacterium]NMD27162.1 hypothetical protein [Chloroflexota bacterium]HOA21691.1 hypothetical protein [Anaerolineaceae bacterium]HOG77577.1 hypothetical protein [Anaerolineaceae bacterium]